MQSNQLDMAEENRLAEENQLAEENRRRSEDVICCPFYPWWLKALFFISGNIPIGYHGVAFKVRWVIQVVGLNILKAIIVCIYRKQDTHTIVYALFYGIFMVLMNIFLLVHSKGLHLIKAQLSQNSRLKVRKTYHFWVFVLFFILILGCYVGSIYIDLYKNWGRPQWYIYTNIVSYHLTTLSYICVCLHFSFLCLHSTLAFLELNRRCFAASEDSPPSKLACRTLSSHFGLYRIADRVNDIFTFPLLVYLGIAFNTLLYYIHYVLNREGLARLHFLDFTLFVAINVLLLLVICLFGSFHEYESSQFAYLLLDAENDISLEFMYLLYTLNAVSPAYSFKAGHFMNLNIATFFTMVGLAYTYTMVLTKYF